MSSMVVIGIVGAAFGVDGWVKINSYTSPQDNCLDYLPWKIKQQGKWVDLEITATKQQGQRILAKFAGYQDRETVRLLTNAEIGIEREKLPDPGKNEYYWEDLEGFTAVTKENVTLGKVDHLFSTGANDVIVIVGEKTHMLPYIPHVIVKVDMQNQVITVDWDPDF